MTKSKPRAATRSALSPDEPARRRAKPGAAAQSAPVADAAAMDRPDPERYVLRLYVTGVSRASADAVERVRMLCEKRLQGLYELEVIDIYQLPALAEGEQIVATPTLIRILPAPLRRYIGNLSDEKLVFGLDLREKH